MTLILTTSDDRRLVDPTPDEVEAVIRGFADDSDSFLILGPDTDESTFMQAAGGAVGGYTLEYQEGDTDQLFQCVINPLPTDHVVLAFRGYLRGDTTWKTALRWEKVDLE